MNETKYSDPRRYSWEQFIIMAIVWAGVLAVVWVGSVLLWVAVYGD